MAAPVTHFEVNAKDAARVREFFSNLFGWKIDVEPTMNYGMVDTGVKMGINGGIGQAIGRTEASFFMYKSKMLSFISTKLRALVVR